MTNSSDARNIYRATACAPSFDNKSSAGRYTASITTSDPSFQSAHLPGTSIDTFGCLNDLRDGSGSAAPIKR